MGLMLTATASVSAAATTPCSGTLPPGTYGDVSVAQNASCTLQPGTTVNGSVTAAAGSTLVINGATINHDVKATNPAAIRIDGSGPAPGGTGSIGHDVKIDGLAGPSTGYNYICNTNIGHDLEVTKSLSTAGPIVIGDDPPCSDGPVSVGHDLEVNKNATSVNVTGNTAGHDLEVKENTGQSTVANNTAKHDAECKDNTSLAAGGNSAGHKNSCGGNFAPEAVFLNTYADTSADTTPPAQTNTPMTPNAYYFADVDGTYSYWAQAQWAHEGTCLGTSDLGPMYPSPDTTNSRAGLDAEVLFSAPGGSSACLQPGPFHVTAFQIDTGSGFSHIEPAGGPYTTPTAGHAYSYVLKGAGLTSEFRFQVVDHPPTPTAGPLKDNSGQLRIQLRAATTDDCKNNGWQQFGAFSKESACKKYIKNHKG